MTPLMGTTWVFSMPIRCSRSARINPGSLINFIITWVAVFAWQSLYLRKSSVTDRWKGFPSSISKRPKYMINAYWPQGEVLGEICRLVRFGSSYHHYCEHIFWSTHRNWSCLQSWSLYYRLCQKLQMSSMISEKFPENQKMENQQYESLAQNRWVNHKI